MAQTLWYGEGRVTVADGSEVISGAGTFWLKHVRPGDVFSITDGGPATALYEVLSIDGDQTITLSRPYQGETKNDAEYAIIRNFTGQWSTNADLAAQIESLVRQFRSALQNNLQGPKGEAGQDGRTVLGAEGAPSLAEGLDGDWYLDMSTWDIYQKTSGAWVLRGCLKGPKGDPGPKGDTGPQGEQGPKGADGLGSGDMMKAVYDPEDTGKVLTASNADYALTAGTAESADWAKISNVPEATAERSGVVRLATEEEAKAGENNVTAVSPFSMQKVLDALPPAIDPAKIDSHIAQTAEAHGIPAQVSTAVDLHNNSATAHRLTADITAALVAGESPSAENPFVTRRAISKGFTKGMIMMWGGLLSEIPEGWALCDGKDGRPNLLGKFIRSVGNTATQPGGTGGTNDLVLQTANLPAHTHSAAEHTHSIVPHTHSFSATSNTADPGHAFSNPSTGEGCQPLGTTNSTVVHVASGNQYASVYAINRATMAANPHSHTVSGTTGSGGPTTTGAAQSDATGATGSGQPISILPPYYELAYIVKL